MGWGWGEGDAVGEEKKGRARGVVSAPPSPLRSTTPSTLTVLKTSCELVAKPRRREVPASGAAAVDEGAPLEAAAAA